MSGNKLDIVLSYRQEYVVTGPVSACNGQLIKNLSNSERAIVRASTLGCWVYRCGEVLRSQFIVYKVTNCSHLIN